MLYKFLSKKSRMKANVWKSHSHKYVMASLTLLMDEYKREQESGIY